jgi:phosphoenolpyruvate carboxykinase (GTP)
MRVLAWIVGRVRNQAAALQGSLGWLPSYQDFDWRGLKFSAEKFNQVMNIDRDEWVQEIASHDELFFKLYDRLPRELPAIRDLLLASLWRTPRKTETE